MELNGIILPDRHKLAATIADILKGKGGLALYLSLAGLIVGFYAVIAVFVIGHGDTINTYSLVPWGLQITTYIYLVLVSTGCTFVNFFGHLFYGKQYQPFASRVIFLGIVTAAAAFISLATEMGRIDRMYRMFISPNVTSPMFWMSVWYSCYMVVIVLEFINIQTRRHSDKVMWGAFIIAVITHSTLGSLLGSISSRPYYYSALLPIYFLFIAFLTGAAATTVIAGVTVRQKRLDETFHLAPFVTFMRIGLGLALITGFWRIMIGLAGRVEGSEVFRLTAANNVLFGIGMAVIVPWIMIKISRRAGWLAFTGLFIMLTQLKTRSDLIEGGFEIPVFRAYETPAIIHYTPSIYEFLILVASVSLVCVLYLVCEKTGLFEVSSGKEAH